MLTTQQIHTIGKAIEAYPQIGDETKDALFVALAGANARIEELDKQREILAGQLQATRKRIAELEAHSAVIGKLEKMLLGEDAPTLTVYADNEGDRIVAKLGNMFKHSTAIDDTLADALTQIAGKEA